MTQAAPDTEETPEEVEEIKRSSQRGVFFVALGVLAVLLAVGVIGKISGTGWFGHRSMLYGTGELYVLNMNETDRHVSVDGLEFVDVPKLNSRLVDLIGGQSEVRISKDAQGTSIEQTYQVTVDDSHAILKLTEDKCLVVADVTTYYQKGGKGKLEVTDKVSAKTHLHVLGTKNVIWPRKPFPAQFKLQDGPVKWVELVGCDLFEEEGFLNTYLGIRLQERFQKARGE